MLDNTKFLTDNQTIINRMLQHPDFVVCRPKTNNYHSLRHKDFGIKLSLDFRKAMENGDVIGYRHLELNTSPHYHFNQYLHNGNDFTPTDCIKSLNDILTYLEIQPQEFEELNVCNIEFGLNTIPETDIRTFIDGLFFYKKTPFKTGDFPYFKKTDATSYKQVKAYAKGLQFADVPQYGINPNTFRFEVKSKQSKNIRKYGINTVDDLLNLETYNLLGQVLLDEWEQVLAINLEVDTKELSHLQKDEVNFIKNARTVDFWDNLIKTKHRNTFGENKGKYSCLLKGKNSLKTHIKTQFIDKMIEFSQCANSIQQTTINRGKFKNDDNPPTLLNLESAHNRKCLVTGLDITMQKRDSKFLGCTGLRYYKENQPSIYIEIEKKYLTSKMKNRNDREKIYYIAHNIRNKNSNPKHNLVNNRKRFNSRNYNEKQLQLFC